MTADTLHPWRCTGCGRILKRDARPLQVVEEIKCKCNDKTTIHHIVADAPSFDGLLAGGAEYRILECHTDPETGHRVVTRAELSGVSLFVLN